VRRSSAFLFLFVLCFGACAELQASTARFFCAIPDALVCEGCAQHLVISLLEGGGCRISFISPPPGRTESRPSSTLRLTVIAPVTKAEPFRRRERPSSSKPALTTSRCFVFNGNSYCE
jgi:hypothetical protein